MVHELEVAHEEVRSRVEQELRQAGTDLGQRILGAAERRRELVGLREQRAVDALRQARRVLGTIAVTRLVLRPLGMSGSKTLGDLFADRNVPRSLRPTLPVVTVGDEIAWVAGVAVSVEVDA